MIQYHRDLIQGSEEWLRARLGLLTASEMSLILSPKTLKPARNDKSSAHLYELLAQRITGYVEPAYVSDDMLRGQVDEIEARALYARHFASAPVEEVGFITNSQWGFTIGYSPDGLVGDDGLLECKSRRAKYQIGVIVDGEIPDEHWLQVQTGLLVTGRAWMDYASYSGGLPMAVVRAYPDAVVHAAILEAAADFEARLAELHARYTDALAGELRTLPTERRIEQEMRLG